MRRRLAVIATLRSASILVALLLAGCGLEPVYVRPSPAAGDGAFIWLDSQAAPPEGYAPVVFAPPDSDSTLPVCREVFFNRFDESGYRIRAIGYSQHDAQADCVFSAPGNDIYPADQPDRFERLWARRDSIYRWDPIDTGRPGNLITSRFYTDNRVLLEPFINRTTGQAGFSWHPCAARYEGTWYIGNIAMNRGPIYVCHLNIATIDTGTVETTTGILLLYAPIGNDPDLFP